MIQIAIYCAIVSLLVKPFGGYMTRVFTGECTFQSPVLVPIERGIHWLCGVDERDEQHWESSADPTILADRDPRTAMQA
jgi:potassium-transporting ATPase potassium-binding subunit